MKIIKATAFLLAFIAAQFATGQCVDGWCWGSDPDKAKEKNALYTDAFKMDNFLEAATHLEWLLTNTPDLNKSIYINGAKIYESLASTETDPTKIKEYTAKTLSMYDMRIKYFNDESDVLNRKAYVAYRLLKDDRSRYQELLDLFDRMYKLNGNDIFANNIVAYMDVLYRYKAAGNALSDDKVFDVYFGLSDIMDYKEATGNPVHKSIRDNCDVILLYIVPVIDCSIVIKDFGPKFEANPELNMAKKIFKLMLTGKCTDDPLAMKVAKMVDDSEPSYGIKLFIGGRSLQNGDKETAIRYFEAALRLTDENVKKGDLYLKIARIKGQQDLKAIARDYALKALDADPSLKDAYSFIGDLYYSSFDDCAGKSDIVLDRGIFLAAYEMYKRGGDGSGMAKAKAQFPSSSEIFSATYQEGQQIKVNCWINTTVTLERRPEN